MLCLDATGLFRFPEYQIFLALVASRTSYRMITIVRICRQISEPAPEVVAQ